MWLFKGEKPLTKTRNELRTWYAQQINTDEAETIYYALFYVESILHRLAEFKLKEEKDLVLHTQQLWQKAQGVEYCLLRHLFGHLIVVDRCLTRHPDWPISLEWNVSQITVAGYPSLAHAQI